MSLSFDTLLEGTMIGAEASALIEAEERTADYNEVSKFVNNIVENFLRPTLTKFQQFEKILTKLLSRGRALTNRNEHMENQLIQKIADVKRTISELKQAINEKESVIKQISDQNPSINDIDKVKLEFKDVQHYYVKLEQSINDFIRPYDEFITKEEKKENRQTVDSIKNHKAIVKMSSDVKKEKKEIEKADGVIAKIKDKIKKLYNDVKKQLVEPTIKGMAITLGLAIATYLAFYGLVKASGGSVKSIVNIFATVRASIGLLKSSNVSFAKKTVITVIGTALLGFIGALGVQGFNYMKAKLSNKESTSK